MPAHLASSCLPSSRPPEPIAYCCERWWETKSHKSWEDTRQTAAAAATGCTCCCLLLGTYCLWASNIAAAVTAKILRSPSEFVARVWIDTNWWDPLRRVLFAIYYSDFAPFCFSFGFVFRMRLSTPTAHAHNRLETTFPCRGNQQRSSLEICQFAPFVAPQNWVFNLRDKTCDVLWQLFTSTQWCDWSFFSSFCAARSS